MPLPDITPVMDSQTIRLRALKVEDTNDMHVLYSDETAMAYWGHAASTDIEQSRQLVMRDLQAGEDGQAIFWAIEHKASGRVIGKCVLWQFSQSNHRAEVGYILSRQYWRGGLMTKALTLMIDYAFSGLGLHRLEADTDDNNMASLALLKKLGFQREGFLRERWYVNGAWQNSVMLGLLKQDWPAYSGNLR